ncbi:MAG: heavy metal translocating P-type ATPase, partial [Nitrospiraceae bacterium]
MYTCDHCLLEFPEKAAVRDEIAGREKVFCCHGCLGIYRFIHNEGLNVFYRNRDHTWVPGPPDEQSYEVAAFTGNIYVNGDVMETDIILDGVRCASCVWLLEKVLQKTDGVIFTKVNYATHRARIRWTSTKTEIGFILDRIRSVGYIPKPFSTCILDEHLKAQKQDLLIRFGTASFFTMQLMLFSVALYAGYFQGMGNATKKAFQVISMLLTIPVVFYAGLPFIKGGLKSFRTGSFNMDVLIATGALSAFVYSVFQMLKGGEVYFDTTAMIITFILLGRYLETNAKGRATEVIAKLLSLAPKEATLVTTDESGYKSIDRVGISTIKVHDAVQVAPGETVPFDGTVIDGSTEVDESMLTGEARPVTKETGSEVFCGTRNLYGSIVFTVTGTGPETILSHIIKTVEEAQAGQAPVQKTADRIVGIFVPSVLALSLLTGIGWTLFGINVSHAVMNSVAVLVIACPCALGLATPLAMLVGTTRAASQGILIKRGEVIEQIRKVDTVMFDKTGTITEGKPFLISHRGIGMDDDEVLNIAASMEKLSEHSLAKAIVGENNRGRYNVSGFTAYPGKGVKGIINGRQVFIGNKSFAESS